MTLEASKVVIVGQGYVGLPVAMRAVEVGYDVVGFDINVTRVNQLNAGASHVEDISDTALRDALDTGRYRASYDPADLDDFAVAVISVPTPLTDGAPDLSFIEDAAGALGQRLTPGACVILESTTYPGTTHELVASILEETSGLVAGQEFTLGYSPERINPGDGQDSFVTTPKVVSGIDERSLEAVKSFYDSLVETTVPVSTTQVAELTKLLENTFRHVNIALVNELAMFANELGINVWEAIDAASTKPFGYMRFEPGPGVGGHCLPIDPSYLSWRVRRTLGSPFRFVELANDINEHMPHYVVSRLSMALNRHGLPLNGQRILLLGFAYKKNTGDARETPARQVARQLLTFGAEVRVADPYVDESSFPSGVERVEVTADELERADAVVLLVDHDDFDLDLIAKATYVLDCRNRLTGPNVERL